MHSWNRTNLPNYLEVFLDIKEETRKKRDPKGLYKKEAHGFVSEMVGSKIQPEIPISPDLYFDELFDVKTECEIVLKRIKR